MTPYVLPLLFTLFVWWFSTGAILYLSGLPRRTHRWTMLAATLVLAGAMYGLALTRDDGSVAAAYAAFTCVVLVWGWQEIAFLLGFVTGPRRTPCPVDGCGWRRASYALETIVYHEFALVVLGVAVALVVADGANLAGLWTFAVLWVMRQSAKLNLFLGVRNLSEDFLPERLRYFESYFRRKPMNPLFPFSLVAATIAAVLVWQHALAADAGSGAAAGIALAGTMLCLAILEHVFMVLPLPSSALWRWGLRSRDAGAPAPERVVVGQGLPL